MRIIMPFFTEFDFKIYISQDRFVAMVRRNQPNTQIIDVKECILHINEPLIGHDQGRQLLRVHRPLN